MQLYVEVGCFAQRSLDAANLRNLRTDVEVDKADAVVQSLIVESLQSLKQF